MSIESHYLRTRIKQHISVVKRYMSLDVDSLDDKRLEDVCSSIEVNIIEIAALTRKLRDLGKLPDNTLEDTLIPVLQFESKGADSQRAFADIGKEYDISKSISIDLKLSRLVDLIIHSYILEVNGYDDSKRFASILITSDFSRFSGIFRVNLKDFLEACSRACEQYPSSIYATYDSTKKSWVYTRE